MTASAVVSLMHPFYGSLLMVLIAVVFLQRKSWHFIWQLNGWRGLIQQPILWILLMCYIDPKSIMTSIQRFRKYFQFPLAIILFDRIMLYVDDPVTMEGILTAPECLNKTFMQNGFYANKGVVHAKDEKWRIRRKQLNPAFSHNTLTSLLDDFNRASHELTLKLAAVVHRDGKIPFADLEDLVCRAVLEISCFTTMGVSINFTQKDEKGIAAAYRHLMETTALRILKPWYQIDFLFRLLDREKYEKTEKAKMLVEEFVAKIVQDKHIEWQKRQHNKCVNSTEIANENSVVPSDPQQSSWCIGHGYKQNDNGNHKVATISEDNLSKEAEPEHRIFIDQIFHLAQTGKMTIQDVMNESQSMMVVSFETVSTCVINALLCLAINRECQVKLRQEIKSQLSNQTASPSKHFPTDSSSSSSSDAIGTAVHGIEDNCGRLTDDTKDENDDKNDIVMDFVDNVTMSHLHRMPYLDMILNESLRLLTTVPINLRNVSAEFQLNVLARRQRDPKASLDYSESNDNTKNFTDSSSSNSRRRHTSNSEIRVVTVPKDTIIALDIFNMQRSPEFWGSNALAFYPEHFEKERQPEEKTQGATRHSYAFIPFSKGLRTCLGYRYSIYLSKIILCKLISSLDFTTNVQLKDLQYCEGVSLKYRNSKDIHFTVRKVSDH